MNASFGATSAERDRLPVLDGVRALSILLVLAAHLLPLNATWPGANSSVGVLGMALFFVLSGFLIGGQVMRRVPATTFVVQRLARIVPLAWLCAVIVALLVPLDFATLCSHLFFYANLPPQTLAHPLEHYWSLCVEIQFYAIAALLLCVRPAFTWVVIPTLLMVVTVFRISTGSTASSVTWIRIDDILAGAMLAMALSCAAQERIRKLLSAPSLLWLSGALLCVSCVLVSSENPFNYLRSYAAATWVGTLICQPTTAPSRWLAHRRWAYLATVSYAVYVLHLPLTATWLGSGDLVEKYLKRPLLLAVLFALAHLSTFHFERHFTQWGRRFGPTHRKNLDPVI